jgi:rhodanese-related sulfurtransferase
MGLLDLFIKQSNKLSSEELKKMMEGSTSVKLIDVRTKEEYAEGHIPNSINIPLQDFKDSIKKMNLPLDTHIVCVLCKWHKIKASL